MDDLITAIADSQEMRLIDPSAVIHPRAFVGDVTIGARTRVWQFASVIRQAVIGIDCVIGATAMVDGTIIGDDCRIETGVNLHAGITIGNGCFIGPNVTFCNDAWPRADKEGFDIDALRAGYVTVLMEDGASIGANAVILPGVRIGAGALVAAGAAVDRDVPAGSLWMREGGVAHALARHRPTRMRSVR